MKTLPNTRLNTQQHTLKVYSTTSKVHNIVLNALDILFNTFGGGSSQICTFSLASTIPNWLGDTKIQLLHKQSYFFEDPDASLYALLEPPEYLIQNQLLETFNTQQMLRDQYTCIGMYNDYNAMLAILNTHKILARDKFGSFLGLMSTKLNGSPECHLGCFQHFCFVFWAPIVDNLLILDSLESLLSALQLEHKILIYHTC